MIALNTNIFIVDYTYNIILYTMERSAVYLQGSILMYRVLATRD